MLVFDFDNELTLKKSSKVPIKMGKVLKVNIAVAHQCHLTS